MYIEWIKKHRQYLRSVVLNEAVTKSFLSCRINRHPKAIFFNRSNLIVDFANHTFQLPEFLLGNNRQIINYNYVAKPGIEFQRTILIEIIIITTNTNYPQKNKKNSNIYSRCNCVSTLLYFTKIYNVYDYVDVILSRCQAFTFLHTYSYLVTSINVSPLFFYPLLLYFYTFFNKKLKITLIQRLSNHY